MKNFIQSYKLFGQIFASPPKPSKLYSAMYPGRNPATIFSRLVNQNYLVKSLTNIEPRISDHKWYTLESSMAGNLMKQGITRENRTNNAFGLNESAEDYKQRLTYIADTICEKIKLNPEVDNLSFQEAPINEHYEYFKQILSEKLPNSWKFYNSAYGVLTIINTKKYQCEEISESLNLTAEMDFGEKDNKYKEDRFRSFAVKSANEQPWILTNIHVPHDNKGAALKTLIVNALKYHLTNFPENGVKHVICGDWNATPEELDAAYEEASQEIKNLVETDSRYTSHVSISTTLSSSVHGHQKSLKPGQTKPDTITVDGVLTIKIEKNYRYENKYKHTEFIKNSSVGLVTVLLTSMGSLLTNKQEQEELKTKSNQEDQIDDLNNYNVGDLGRF